MPSHIAILSIRPARSWARRRHGRARVAQAYGRLPPAALMLLAVISVELSWALATVVFADVGEAGTAWLSTTFAAIVFTADRAPQDRRPAAEVLVPDRAVRLDRCGHDLAVPAVAATRAFRWASPRPIAFLGPLGLAVATSRRLVHFLWVGVAALGVVLLTPAIGDGLSMVGLGFAAVSACAWAAFVPATKLVGRAFGGRDGLTFGLWASSLMLLPFAVVEGTVLHADALSIGGVLLVALLGAVLPWAIEFSVMQRISARTYGILVTLEPAVGALVGAIFLSQAIGLAHVDRGCLRDRRRDGRHAIGQVARQ